MPDIEIASAFEQIFYKKIVRITACSLSPERKSWFGTGCIIGYVKNPKYQPKALIATAGHVLIDERTKWTVERLDSIDSSSRKVVFETPNDNPLGPRVFYYNKDPRLDIGGMYAEANCVDGRSFIDLDHSGEPTETVIPIIDKREGFGPGTRVAWAGFPQNVQDELGFSQLCYYEGVVAAMIDRKGYPPLYLIDGHNTFGVSGGPVWAWSDNRSRVELIAIIVSYLSDVQKNLPGFVCATPIHPLLYYLGSQNRYSGSHKC
ncbi:MAG: hypothetical protein WC476_09575 [Phycisphaerae bacterium]|jgi:hypothetical protein